MGYTALYRKWRSKDFDDIVGQDAITRSFKNQVSSGRVGHAYLFCGTRGTGKTSLAKILARAVNCTNPVNAIPVQIVAPFYPIPVLTFMKWMQPVIVILMTFD